MNDFKLFLGEDFALSGEITFREEDSSTSITDFDIDLEISTTPLGKRIWASTSPGSDTPVLIRSHKNFGINIPAELTALMTPGIMSVSLSVTHKKTGVRSIGEDNSYILITNSRIASINENRF